MYCLSKEVANGCRSPRAEKMDVDQCEELFLQTGIIVATQ